MKKIRLAHILGFLSLISVFSTACSRQPVATEPITPSESPTETVSFPFATTLALTESSIQETTDNIYIYIK